MTLSRATLAWSILAGTLLGIGYAASPLTIWFGVWTAWLFWWSARGLGDRERRAVWFVLGAAVAVRVVPIAIQFLSVDTHQVTSFFFDGDGVYLKQRALAIRNAWLGAPLPPSGSLSFENVFYPGYGWTSYLYVLAYVQFLLGPAPYGVHLINVELFITAVLVLYRIVRNSYGVIVAIAGLVLVCFLPTLIAWSSSALKESIYLFLGVLAVAGTIRLVRARHPLERLLALIVVAASLAAVGTIRQGGLLIAATGVTAGLVGTAFVRKPVALIVGFAIVMVVVGVALQRPSVRTTLMGQVQLAAYHHQGNVITEGHAYKLLEPRFYVAQTIDRMTPIEGLRFVVRALVAFVLVPLPWDAQSHTELAFLAQQTIWLVMVVFAGIGLFAGLARDPLVTLLLACTSAAAAGVIALNSGNVGTMVRFRDTMMPFAVWLSALGGITFLRWVAARAWSTEATGGPQLGGMVAEGS